jgi:hypothetical protein
MATFFTAITAIQPSKLQHVNRDGPEILHAVSYYFVLIVIH